MNRMSRFTVISIAVLSLTVSLAYLVDGLSAEPREGDKLIGSAAPGWGQKQWINSKPLYLADLRGKVVLIRWWTDICPFCVASSDGLNTLEQEFKQKGLQVIGMYHPKPRPKKVSLDFVSKAAETLDFKFPIGIDFDWSALNAWWLDATPHGYTSVSFVLDKEGIIRYVHPGPEFHPELVDGEGKHKRCVKDYKEIREIIQDLL